MHAHNILPSTAILAVVDGDLATLRALLDADPSLVRARSAPPHRATLLHYLAANGVEDELQRTPANAPAVLDVLLAAGAEPDALADSYGGGPRQTPLCLVASSWHPHAAGLQVALVHGLLAGGARVDGMDGDGAPLTTALTFGYTRTAEALADAGARVDNVPLAAGLGRVDQVTSGIGGSIDAAWGTFASVLEVEVPRDRARLLQEALHFAVSHDRLATAELLLARGAKANGTVTGHHASLPLAQAVFLHRPRMQALLERHGADADALDPKLGVSPRQLAQRLGAGGP